MHLIKLVDFLKVGISVFGFEIHFDVGNEIEIYFSFSTSFTIISHIWIPCKLYLCFIVSCQCWSKTRVYFIAAANRSKKFSAVVCPPPVAVVQWLWFRPLAWSILVWAFGRKTNSPTIRSILNWYMPAPSACFSSSLGWGSYRQASQRVAAAGKALPLGATTECLCFLRE